MDKLSIVRESALLDKLKRDFFQILSVSVLLFDSSAWTLTKTIGQEAKFRLYKDATYRLDYIQETVTDKKKELYGDLQPISHAMQGR